MSGSQTVFETKRLIARRLHFNDLTSMLAVYGDADAMRWVGDSQPITEKQCVEWLEVTENNYRLRGYGMFTLVERDSSEVVGFCGLVHPDEQVEPEIKYALKRRYWGLGFATEAAIGLLHFGAEVKGLRHVIATAALENTASHRVLLKAGMNYAQLRENEDGSYTQLFVWHARENQNAL